MLNVGNVQCSQRCWSQPFVFLFSLVVVMTAQAQGLSRKSVTQQTKNDDKGNMKILAGSNMSKMDSKMI